LGYQAEAVRALDAIATSGRKRALEVLHNYTKGEVFVLSYLHLADHAVPPRELSRALDSSTARISAILRSLEHKGEIARGAGVTITEAGRVRAKAVIRRINHTLIRVFRDMGRRDTEEFIRLANKFLNSLSHSIESN
jgi:DNA-binding MarR family transcriptional regulator